MSGWWPVVEVLAAVALLSGGALAALAGLGLVRLPDVASRLQAATKPQVLGLVLVCLGVAPLLRGAEAVALALVALFQLATAPIMAQVVGRSAYHAGQGRQRLLADELADRPGDSSGGGTSGGDSSGGGGTSGGGPTGG